MKAAPPPMTSPAKKAETLTLGSLITRRGFLRSNASLAALEAMGHPASSRTRSSSTTRSGMNLSLHSSGLSEYLLQCRRDLADYVADLGRGGGVAKLAGESIDLGC